MACWSSHPPLMSGTCPDATLENTKNPVTWGEEHTWEFHTKSGSITSRGFQTPLQCNTDILDPESRCFCDNTEKCSFLHLQEKYANEEDFQFPSHNFIFLKPLLFTTPCWLEKISCSSKERKILEQLWEWALELDLDSKNWQNESATYCCIILGISLF